LRMVMTIGLDEPSAAARIAQLTQKTNQFNLTTRRHTEAEIAGWMRDPEWLVAHFALTDVCGDNGIVGAAIVRGASGPRPEFDTFLLSCRVIGRSAESAFLLSLLGLLRERGAERVRGAYVPTPKNTLVASFWTDHGFAEVGPGLFERTLDAVAPFAGPISVIIPSKMRTPAGRPPA
ncbi:MAG TPA: hypothetical protein VFA98_04555, partial [Thermoanaerobaculia bacterium]|nr:hypothetical protein [Thermoanaerobaculia bacterium]